MTSFIQKYYNILFVGFLALIVVLSFIVGYQRGKEGTTGGNSIVFSCPNSVLDAQKISLSAEAGGTESTTTSSTSLQQATATQTQTGGAYVGSKNGTKYYTPGCPATNRIKPENLIWFQTAQDATLQGYTKGSC